MGGLTDLSYKYKWICYSQVIKDIRKWPQPFKDDRRQLSNDIRQFPQNL